jgi:hypothetical protein
MAVEFVPMRWWQTIDYIRTDFETARGRDPWVDRVLSHPWSPSSLLEYAYALAEIPFSIPYYIVVSGERIGTLWLTRRSRLLYIFSLGLLPHFRESDTGMQAGRLLIKAVRCIEDCAKRFNSVVSVGKIAACNAPIQRMVKIFDAKPLGLATTTLALAADSFKTTSFNINTKEIKKADFVKAWRHWKLRAVAHVAGNNGIKAATILLEGYSWIDPLPKGEYFALEQDGEEIGVACAHRREGETELSLLTAANRWTGQETAALIAAMASRLDTIRYLTVTQKHADILDETPAFEFERKREQERHFVFWIVKDYFAKHARRRN